MLKQDANLQHGKAANVHTDTAVEILRSRDQSREEHSPANGFACDDLSEASSLCRYQQLGAYSARRNTTPHSVPRILPQMTRGWII